MPVRAVGRGDHVTVFERATDADRDRLLADAGVQEPRELACAEAFGHLLLEAPNQQHLGEEADEFLARQLPLRGHVSAASRSTRSTSRQL